MTRRALLAVTVAFTALSASAATGPAAPQAGLDPGVSVARGDGLFIDADGYARYVWNGAADELDVPTFSTTEWQSFRAAPAPNVNVTVACPPVQVTLCKVAGSIPVTMTLPTPQTGPGGSFGYNPVGYGVVGQQATASSVCVDLWGAIYWDSITGTCAITAGSGAMAVAAWQDAADNDICQPNAHTDYGGCDASCGDGSMSYVTYDSCANVTGSGYTGCYAGPCPPPPPPPAQPPTDGGGTATCTPYAYLCPDGTPQFDCGGPGGGSCALPGGSCSGDSPPPSCATTGGSTWTTTPAPCNACDCIGPAGQPNAGQDLGPGCCC